MMSLRVVHAGGGYQYLLRSVATNDADAGKQQLHDYYAAKGTPQGRWRGRGISGLESKIVTTDSLVTAEQMSALYGEGLHPDTDMMLAEGKGFNECKLGRAFPNYTKNNELLIALSSAEKSFRDEHQRRPDEMERSDIALTVGSQFYVQEFGGLPDSGQDVIDWVNSRRNDVRQAVSGFDMTFSPVKSVSTLWALADEQTSSLIAQMHHEAVADVLRSIEDNALYTRSGYGGIEQVKTRGMIASEFTHFDTRAGDPDLHSHVLVSNKVQDVDGQWKSIDSQVIHHFNAASGQLYNLALKQRLEARLGVNFVERYTEPGKSAVWEIEGINPELMQRWSSRRELARPVFDRAVADYIETHGKAPGKRATHALWQQAILDTRDAKKPAESLESLREMWREQALEMMSESELDGLVESVCRSNSRRPVFSLQRDLTHACKASVALAMSRRSEIRRSHLETAINQTLNSWAFRDVEHLDRIRSHVLNTALSGELLNLTPGEVLDLPQELTNASDQAIDRSYNTDRYTTSEQLAAENKVMDAARAPQPLFVSEDSISQAVDAYEATHGHRLNEGQVALARHLLTRGTLLAVGVGPAGTGKTTSMKLVADLWKAQGRNVIGLAPSAAAANVLAKDITSECHTIDSLTYRWNQELDQGNDPRDLIGRPGFEINPGDMLLVDEAGMASTDRVSTLVDIARASGATIRMVGDPAQLDSVDTGGIFRTLTNEPGTPQLDQVMRMSHRDSQGRLVIDHEQADATLAIRNGDISGINLHYSRDWVRSGAREEMITDAVDGYLRDTHAGKRSLVVAPTNADVRIMNEMIQSVRESEGKLSGDTMAMLSDGLTARTGDVILARRNTFVEQPDSATAMRVLNGQTMTVETVHADGSVTSRDQSTGNRIWLDSTYIRQHTQLGYASTLHRCQGATVDTTHCIVDPTVDRNGLYVGVTRGKKENRLYTVIGLRPDESAEEAHLHSAGDADAADARTILERIVVRDDSQRSALDVMKQQMVEATSPERIRSLYIEGAQRATRAYALAETNRYVDLLPASLGDQLAPGTDGHEAIAHALTHAAQHGVSVGDVWAEATEDIDWADNPGRLIGSRIRTLTDKYTDHGYTEHALPTPPPFVAGADPELALWLESTHDSLTAHAESQRDTDKETEPTIEPPRQQLAPAARRTGKPLTGAQAMLAPSDGRLRGAEALRAIQKVRVLDSKLERITHAIESAEQALSGAGDTPADLQERVDKAYRSAEKMRTQRAELADSLPDPATWPQIENQTTTPAARDVSAQHTTDKDTGVDL